MGFGTDITNTGFGVGGGGSFGSSYGDGEGSKDCHKQRVMSALLTTVFEDGKMFIGDWIGKRTKGGMCDHALRCPLTNLLLKVGEQVSVVQIEADGKSTTEKKCDPCKSEKGPMATLVESLGPNTIEALREFMDKICSDPDSDSTKTLKITLAVACYEEKIEDGCKDMGAESDCKKQTVERWGPGSSRNKKSINLGFYKKEWDLPNDVFDVLSGKEIPLDMVCELWDSIKSCIFQGDGTPVPGIEDTAAACFDKYFNLDYVEKLADDLDIDLGHASDEDIEELLREFIEDITDCICKKE